VGSNGMIELSSTLISPAVTWFTTGAGLLLILAAIAQSVRRVKKNRAEK
jgi:cytochrome oxidase assembly protein ShyY1